MNRMTFIFSFAILLLSPMAWAQSSPTAYVCLESGQTAMYLVAVAEKGQGTHIPNKVELTEYAPDGTTKVTKLEGFDPDLDLSSATDEEGTELLIITSISPTPSSINVRVLVCFKD